MMGKVIFTVGSCGGTGNSFFTCAVASALAIQSNRKCLIIDTVKGFTFTDYIFGADKKAVATFDDFLSGFSDLDDVIFKTDIENLSIIPSSEDISTQLDVIKLGLAIKLLINRYDYVFIDANSIDTIKIMSKFFEKYSVIINALLEPCSVMNAQLLADCAGNFNGAGVSFVVNKFDKYLFLQNENFDNIDTVIDLLQIPLLGIIPYDEDIRKLLCQKLCLENTLHIASDIRLKNKESAFSAVRRIALRMEGSENTIVNF